MRQRSLCFSVPSRAAAATPKDQGKGGAPASPIGSSPWIAASLRCTAAAPFISAKCCARLASPSSGSSGRCYTMHGCVSTSRLARAGCKSTCNYTVALVSILGSCCATGLHCRGVLEPSSMSKSTSTSEAPWRDAMLRTGDDLPPYLMAGGPDTG